DVLEVEALQEIQIKIGEVVDVVEPLGLVREAVPRVLGHQDVEAQRELLHERQDRRRAARAVQEDKRRSGTAAPQAGPAAVDLHKAWVEAHVLRFLPVTPDASITIGISAKFIGAMTWAPATPGMSASSCSTSMQILRPSRLGSAAFSRRDSIAS